MNDFCAVTATTTADAVGEIELMMCPSLCAIVFRIPIKNRIIHWLQIESTDVHIE